MIKPEVDRLVHMLESKFDPTKHTFPTEIWESIMADEQVNRELSKRPLDALVIKTFTHDSELDPFNDYLDKTFDEITNCVSTLCNKGAELALTVLTAGLAYYGHKEGLLDSPIYNIHCNSDDACVACLTQGRPTKPSKVTFGDNTMDVINVLKQNMLSNSEFEAFVRGESRLVTEGLQNLTKLLPWSPLESPRHVYPTMTPEDFGLSVQHLVEINRNLSFGKFTPISTITIFSWLQPDRDVVFKSFGSGDGEAFSVIGTYLTFVYQMLKKLTACDVSAIELTPMLKYIINTTLETMGNRLSNRYVQLVLMGINAMVVSIEYDYFHICSETSKTLATQLVNNYEAGGSCEFEKHGICKHGVPDDMYEWMTQCLKSNVLPSKVRHQLKNASLYPMIGPVRLLFDDGYFASDIVEESVNQQYDPDKVLESMTQSLFDAVDPAKWGSLRVDPVAGESGVSGRSWTELLQDHSVLEATLSQLHTDNDSMRKRNNFQGITEVTMAQSAILEALGDKPCVHAKLNALIENTRRDIINGRETIRPYKNMPSFRRTMEAAKTDAIKRIIAITEKAL